MLYRIDQFSGEIPRAYPTLLPKGAATAADDAKFDRGVIEPLRASPTVHTASETVVDFYRHTDGSYLTFDSRRSVVPGPVATDRLYIAETGQAPIIKIMPGGTEYDLAVTTPPAVPTVAIATAATEPGPDDPPLAVETVVYAYTWVTTLDEESLPSSPSAAIAVTEGSTVTVGFTDQPPTGTRIDRLRLYRSVTGASGATAFFFVKELNSGVTSFVHDVSSDAPQELLPSVDYDPPVLGLEGLTAMQNGIVAGFKGRNLYFCEPYKPHAWPAKYALQTDFDIVGLAAFGPYLAVLTEGQPYRVEGTLPESMVMSRLDISAPCLSAASIVDMGYSAIYAGPDGLIEITAAGAPTVVTQGVYTRAQWRALDPSTIVAAYYHANYVFTADDGSGQETRMLQMQDGPRIVQVSQFMDGMRHDKTTGDLLFSSGLNVKRFSDVTALPLSVLWKSGPVTFTTYETFGIILVEGIEQADPSGFSIKVYADDLLIDTLTTINEPERLSPIPAKKWQFQIEGKVDVFRVSLASSYDELIA